MLRSSRYTVSPQSKGDACMVSCVCCITFIGLAAIVWRLAGRLHDGRVGLWVYCVWCPYLCYPDMFHGAESRLFEYGRVGKFCGAIW